MVVECGASLLIVREDIMPESDSHHDALDRHQAVDNYAAVEVIQRFADRLIRLAGARLDTQFRRQPVDELLSATS